MSVDLPFSCSCGQLHGFLRGVEPSQVNCNSCCCAGCQRYARYMGRERELLDEHGATFVVQVAPSTVQVVEGQAHLACLQQTPKGAYRWYASCCRTPLLNTLWTPSVPFAGILVHCCVPLQKLEHPLEHYVGPNRALVNGKFPRQQAKALRATFGALIKMLVRLCGIMIGWMWRGEHRRSPFFLPGTKTPIVEVQKLYLLEKKEHI